MVEKRKKESGGGKHNRFMDRALDACGLSEQLHMPYQSMDQQESCYAV